MLNEPQYSYIQGRAGTGKSYKLKQIYDRYPGSTALCATTGIAAVNLGAGTTINSLLWYYNTESLLDTWTSGKLLWRLEEIYNKMGIRRILLDEVSMLPASNLSVLCLAIDKLNEHLHNRGKPLLQFILAGDFAQLPPVSGDFAFESEHWEKFLYNTTILREVYRQEDAEFIQALQWVREGKGKQAAEYFEESLHKLGEPDYEGTTLYPYNSAVTRQNAYRLEKIKGEPLSFPTTRSGKQRGEWKKYIPDHFKAKIGALVMLLANNYSAPGQIEYCNGDLGTIESYNEKAIFIRLLRNNNLVVVENITRENEEIKDNTKKVVGSVNYMPIRLAYASTIHKGQGLTFDNIQVDIRAKFYAECPGMLYVALSRCRTKEGLRLIGGPRTFATNCKVNPKIKEFL